MTRALLQQTDLRTGQSPRTNPKKNPVSQALKKDKPSISFHCSKVVRGAKEKLPFSIDDL